MMTAMIIIVCVIGFFGCYLNLERLRDQYSDLKRSRDSLLQQQASWQDECRRFKTRSTEFQADRERYERRILDLEDNCQHLRAVNREWLDLRESLLPVCQRVVEFPAFKEV